MFTYTQLHDRIDAHIAQLSFTRTPQALYAPMSYLLRMESKRIRPVLMMMAYNLYQDAPEEILAPATAIEAFHNYTLMHDDLMDKADMRRGKATVHKVWSENSAILSGDAMLVMAYQWMAEVPEARQKKVLEVFSQTALEICEGQQMDMDFEIRTDVTEREYMEMIRLKTAVLLAASLKIGALLGGAPASDAKWLYDYGIQLGLAFQLRDDWLDVYGNPTTFGKNIGGDILCNKKTFLLIKAWERANETDRKELDRWTTSTSTANAAEKIAAVTALYDKLGIGTVCEEAIKQYSLQATAFLDTVKVEEAKKTELNKLVSGLTHRTV
jgi:geranylgeranyl diphosphate synthase type II